MTGTTPSEKRTLVAGPAWTMRELLTKARERFGPDAARYKTRQELLEALGLVAATIPEATAPVEAAPAVKVAEPLVVRDFFLPPTKR